MPMLMYKQTPLLVCNSATRNSQVNIYWVGSMMGLQMWKCVKNYHMIQRELWRLVKLQINAEKVFRL